MNFYVLVEGKSTEKMLLRAWLKFVFPSLSEVQSLDSVMADNYFILSGKGYPQYLDRIPEALQDIARHGNIDHFIVWIDSEENSYDQKVLEIQQLIEGREYFGRKHIIVANCCVETWLIANKKMLKKVPASQVLRSFKRFYDVSRQDPEVMGNHPEYNTKAQFHYEYLREMHFDKGLSYTKNHPGTAQEKHYFDALVSRLATTNHIPSFRSMLDCFKAMGSEYL